MAKPIPEIVYLLGLLADERCGPGRGSPFSKRSQSLSCWGDRGIPTNPAGSSFSGIIGNTALVSDIMVAALR
jgi:hypothetical protein